MFSKKKKLITHNGSFHADDIFAAAALAMYLAKKGERYEVIRTRDEEVIKTGDYVFDVGGIYDKDANRFDHHQKGGAGQSGYGIEYSSFGLVWQKFGGELAGGDRPAEIVARRLVAPIDAWDNGQDLVENKSEIGPYYIQSFFNAMVPTWKEGEKDIDKVFLECVGFARTVLGREIVQASHLEEAETEVRAAYESAPDKRIIILDKNYPFEYVLPQYPEPLFAVYPRRVGSWGVKAVRKDIKSFENRKNLPAPWGGLRDRDLAEAAGVSDAVFCHRNLFLAVAESREGAIALAKIAAGLEK